MVLVLMAGAVPSHGRTESEGTVFNKTQPHEGMNNVTVSSSKLETYGYLYLVMQWPRSFCNSINRPCSQQVPGRFTVHGLWPQYPSISRGGINCKIGGIYGHYPLFNSRKLDPSLVPGLNKYWLDLTKSENNNHGFWKAQYDKHGSCTFNNQDEYFYLTLTMVASLGDLVLKLSLIRPGPRIIPGHSYRSSVIRDAVYSVTHKMPMLHCITVGNIVQLLEIRFCASRNSNQLSDCNFYSNCGNGMVYLPRP